MPRVFTLLLLLALQPLTLSAGEQAATPRRDPARLRLLGPEYPRVFFFRASEMAPRRPGTSFDVWDAEFSRLMGIMGKCLDEEVLHSEAHNPEFFTRFKQKHPEQAVLLHFNGNSRDPRYHTDAWFPGHWIYRKAARILADVPAESGESEIQVEDASDFRVNMGRYRTSTDDLALFGLTADGRHDWNHCEQVQLLAVDAKQNRIRVKRGCYGTKPLAFRAGQARAAAHASEGPWGKRNNLLWFYNYSTDCPRDAQGRNAADRLVEDLAAWFGRGGKLAAFDGLEFDVLFHETHGDTDGDGTIDNGVINGRNQYGIGVIEFVRKLRQRMGDAFIIQADGALGPGGVHSQRAFGLLNGIESEGWPNLNDWDFDDWSGGLNRQAFWQANARPPAFNYINHKWVEPVPGKPGEMRNASAPWSRHRLVFAAAQFADAMLCYTFPPPPEPDGKIGIWDEFRCGADGRLGWLGRPQGPAIHLARQSPNLLPELNLGRRPGGVAFHQPQPAAVPNGPPVAKVGFSFDGIAVPPGDLTVFATLKAQPRTGYPPEMARFVRVEASGGRQSLIRPQPEDTGMRLRGHEEQALDPATGALVRFAPRQSIAGRSLPSYAVHPPYQQHHVGYVYWTHELQLPPHAELRFDLGMGEKSPQRSDGVWFQVWIAQLAAGQPGNFEKVFERSTKDHAWIPCRVDLARWSGKSVRLKFVADCGPNDNATTDHGYWGDVRVVDASEGEAADLPAKSSMTWVNGRSFESSFYFPDMRSKKVWLTFEIEAPEPATIEAISLHAHPDAMYRVFENGIVLANPGRAPYTFDLDALSPGRHYRRLRATPGQDLQVNSGSAVRGRVTLEARDALFLLRTSGPDNR